MELSFLKDQVSELLYKKIKGLILDPDFRFSINKIELLKESDCRTNRSKNILFINIITNNRSLLLGQFIYFNKEDLRGFHLNYLYGILEAWCETKHKRYSRNLEFYINVQDSNSSLSDVYRYLDSSLAIKKKIITPLSPLAKIISNYSLSHILLAGNEISSPTLGMTNIVESICRKYKPRYVLDIFSGSGALSKICLMHGAQSVDCVELNSEIIDYNLNNFKGRYDIYKMDAFAFIKSNFDKKYDLIIVDPFFEHAYRAAREIIPQAQKYTKILIFDIGPKFDSFWRSKIISCFRKSSFEEIIEAEQSILIFQ